MKLYIAEKPSLGRAVADALPTPHRKSDGYITVGNGDVVSWCIGHLLEQVEPDAYDESYKKWKTEHLPIVPTQWQLKVKSKTRSQFSTLKKLIKQADILVNVGDPDREGQILIDEVINQCKVSKAKLASTQRCLISDLNPRAVQKSLENLRSNSEFVPLATSALARARADWLYGINMTRLCTIQGQQSGFSGVLSIGRVQTPLLGLVVKRDTEIEKFEAKPFYELDVTLRTQTGYDFIGKWKPSEACAPYMDEEDRLVSRPLAENVATRVINQHGQVIHFKETNKKQAPPLPYNLSSLQIDAAKRFGMSAKQVLDTCQQLYERHKLITYPRSDCRYLPSGHFSEALAVTETIFSNTPDLAALSQIVDLNKKSKAWNDKKISAHHAIIPTLKKVVTATLNSYEKNIYDLVARQYLMQFLAPFEYRQVDIHSSVAGGIFTSKRKELLHLGWKVAISSSDKKKNQTITDADKNQYLEDKMPTLTKGTSIQCIDTQINDKVTSPPKRFNDATLLAAMTGIARYVQDPDIKKVLRETDGLGTEATRAGIIELLFKRQFLNRKGKEIHSTEIGRQLINNLPTSMSLPDMTAQWESQLNSISQRELKYTQFMEPMTYSLHLLIDEVQRLPFDNFKGLAGTSAFSKKRKSFKKTYKKTSGKKKSGS